MDLMKRLGKGKVSRVFIYIFIVFAILAISLRVISRVSPTIRNYLDAVIGRYPVFFAALLMTVMVSAVWISFIKYSERKTKSTLVKLVVWLAVSAVFLFYGIYQLCMDYF